MRLKKREFKLTLPAGEMNVVSLMDVLTTLLFFLLLTATFTKLSAVPASGVPSYLPPRESDDRPKFTLEIVAHSPSSATVFLGPLEGLRPVDRGALADFLKSGYQGNESLGYLRKIDAKTQEELITALRADLALIKRGFPQETTAVVAFSDPLKYQEMIDMLGAVRSLASTDEPIEVKQASGQKELTQVLFPQIVISEWSEDAEGT